MGGSKITQLTTLFVDHAFADFDLLHITFLIHRISRPKNDET